MLKLRRIELLGFKSFYDHSEICVTATGVTAVVGPNGCGKSNISDAVAWVLGEQRARSLRGDRMEDVIFSGTGKRSPLGMAEVKISLIDDAPPHSNGGPPPGPLELTVQRRLFRSGESQYLLNGRPCKLREVQELFLGTGLGPQSYAIIEQGRIGQLLSARPTELRALIEEAAGITKFKAKKKLAESRLGAAQRNVSRVSDILAEVERQCGSLKRQASKARRYREVRKRMRRVLAAIFSTRAEGLIEGQDRVAAALDGLSPEGNEVESRIAALEAKVHQARTDLETGERELEDSRERQVLAKLELEKAGQRIERLEDQVRSLDQRTHDMEAEKGRVQTELQRRQSELDADLARLSDVENSAVELRKELSVSRDGLEKLSQRCREEEHAIDEIRNKRFEVVGSEAEISNELSSKKDLLDRIQHQITRVGNELEEAVQDKQGLEVSVEAAEVELSRVRAETEELRSEQRKLQDELEVARREHRESLDLLHDARAYEQGTRHRLETIRELSLDRAYGTESVQQFFSRVRNEPWAPLGIVADFVEVEPEYESVVEDLLHGELQYVVVEDLLHAEKALSIVRSHNHGRLHFWVTDPPPPDHPDLAQIPNATPVRELVRFDDRLSSFASSISNAYVVDDLASAWNLSVRYPTHTFVSRTGEVVRDRVISWGERSSHGPLSLKREMRELDRRVDDARRATRLAEDESSSLNERVDQMEGRNQDLTQRLRVLEKEELKVDHNLGSLRSELERVEQRRGVAQGEIARFEQEHRELSDGVADGRTRLAEVKARKNSIDAELENRVETGRKLREEAEQQAAAVAELRSQLAVLEERTDTLVRSVASLKSQRSELDERHSWAAEQIETATRQKTEAFEAIAEDQSAYEELGTRIDEMEKTLKMKLDQLEGLRRILHEAEEGWDQARADLDSWKDRHNQIEIEKTRIESDIKHLMSLCFNELGESIESVCLDSFETLSPGEIDAHESEYQELRRKIDSMGNVNMMAVEEYEEAEQRFVFLSAQRQDLLDSIRDTTQAIEEIDTVCRKQFGEAFRQINFRFSESFVELFGGGRGELRLIDDVDSADAGIELVVQPPGKKLQNVLLLSGGEKALAALALVVGMFRFRPSPFCVLDEVDAPLDDANIDRFANMIRDMSGETQFIVITHSKRTMETANQLYGVTMEEPGVSKVVSVRLN